MQLPIFYIFNEILFKKKYFLGKSRVKTHFFPLHEFNGQRVMEKVTEM